MQEKQEKQDNDINSHDFKPYKNLCNFPWNNIGLSRQKAFPFGEGVGIVDGRGLCLPTRRSHWDENKESSRPMQIGDKWKRLQAETSLVAGRHSPRRGKLFCRVGRQPLCRFNSAEREDKRYVSFNLPSGKAIFPDLDLKQTRYITINYNKLQIFTKVGL